MPWGGWGARPPRVSLSARRAWIEIIGLTYDGLIASVALRKESVDRNIGPLIFSVQPRKSLSARRAWIEISTRSQPSRPRRVALRKESVDRNRGRWHFIHRGPQSLSARRAWIEIGIIMGGPGMTTLSLSARRAWIEITRYISSHKSRKSLSARRAWIEICYLDNIEISEASRSPQGERG